MAKETLPAIVKFRSIEPYDKQLLEAKFDSYLDNGGNSRDLERFQEYVDYVAANENLTGKLDQELIRVSSNKITVSNNPKLTPEHFATPDEDFLPYKASLTQISIDYILIRELDKGKYLATEGWNLGKFVGGENVECYCIDINQVEVVSYQIIN